MRNRIANDNAIRDHPAERKHPLRNANGDQPGLSEAVLNGSLEVTRPAELAVDDNQADGPVHHHRQTYQQQDAADKAGLAHSVGLADDTRANDGIGHVHKG
ncbi:hypothetical protein HG531_000246 [Fusarium graminearum]|nr:hypothetical protein HG531_000246 [Fusarium graminearum]